MTNKEAILIALQAIPTGKVISYGNLAKQAGIPNGARQVGHILKQLPPDTTLAWHRVVNSQRKLSFKPGSEQYQKQFDRLTQEGVIFVDNRIQKAFFIK